MVISSLVVETTPDATEAAAVALAGFEGVEVHDIHGYKVVVTIEAETLDESHDIAAAFIAVPGVTNINLIYVNFEDDPTVNPACGAASEAADASSDRGAR